MNIQDENNYIFDTVETKWEKGNLALVLPKINYDNLPTVSVLTITKDRSHFFPLSLHNWINFKYPKDKIEWVIIDDSKEDNISKNFKNDNRIKYHHLKSILSISDKRNYGVKKCIGKYIVHMDDDDYYFPDSILARILILLKYPEKECVFSMPLGVYNLTYDKSAILTSKGKDIPEATMTYSKKFWKEGKFGNNDTGNESEWYKFVGNRKDKFINMPFWFNMIAFNHRENTTGIIREFKKDEKASNFTKMFSKETKDVIEQVRDQVDKKHKLKYKIH